MGNNRTAGKSQRSEPWDTDGGQGTLQLSWVQRGMGSRWLKRIRFRQDSSAAQDAGRKQARLRVQDLLGEAWGKREA